MIFFVPALLGTTTLAATLDFTTVREDDSSSWQSVFVDPSNGKIYQRPGFGLEGQMVNEFNDHNSFEAGTPARTISLEGGYFGTYVAASYGSLFGRTSNFTGTSAARFDLGSGAITLPVGLIPGMRGNNPEDTFDWGGFSGVNFFNDGSSLYLLGKLDSPDGATWEFLKIDDRFNWLDYRTFTAPSIGFATIINGKLFFSEHYTDSGFEHVFDYAANELDDVAFTFNGAGGSAYFDNLLFDPTSDTLYAHNANTETFYKLENASEALTGEEVHPVPEAGPYAGILGALFLLNLRNRKRRPTK